MFGLNKDAMHIYIGLSVFLIWIVLFKKKIDSFKSIIPVAVVAFLLEIPDLYADYTTFGYCRFSASLHDIINTSLWPQILILAFKYLIKTGSRS